MGEPEGPQPPVAEDYNGPERRQEHREVGWSIGLWMMRHSRTWAAVLVAHFVILAFVALGTGISTSRTGDQLELLKRQVEQANRTAADAHDTSSFVRDCLLRSPPAERCPSGGSGTAVLAVVTYLDCVLTQPFEGRTPEFMAGCKAITAQLLEGK